jgi:hypothetical protein
LILARAVARSFITGAGGVPALIGVFTGVRWLMRGKLLDPVVVDVQPSKRITKNRSFRTFPVLNIGPRSNIMTYGFKTI